MKDEEDFRSPTKELTRRVEQLSRLIEVSQSVAAQLDLDPLLQQIVDTATELVSAKMGGLLVLAEEEESFRFFKVSGWPYDPKGFPTGKGLLSLPYREGKPVRLENVRNHPQAVGFPPLHPEVGAFLSVPLIRKGSPLGALFVGNEPDGSRFSSDDERLLSAFAAQALFTC
jgi:GAF domain-containing protein